MLKFEYEKFIQVLRKATLSGELTCQAARPSLMFKPVMLLSLPRFFPSSVFNSSRSRRKVSAPFLFFPSPS